MPTLTALTPDPRRTGYRLVEVDRGRFASLPADALEPLDLSVGSGLSPKVLEALQQLADVEAAYRSGLRALAARECATGALRRRLIHKQHPPDAVDCALERLVAQGLLDDERFARVFAARRVVNGKGPARLITDLLSLGVSRAIAEAAVRQAFADEGVDPEATVRAVAERRAAQLAGLPPYTRRRRLVAFLARRGYPASTVRELIQELIG